MKRVIIIQARTTSTRLPGKVLLDLGGRPMLAQQIRRLKACRHADMIVVATTVNATDDPIAHLAQAEGAGCFRGDEHDVLARYVGAALASQADVIIRTTADCPLIDPEITDRVIAELVDHAADCDYASNVLKRTYPRGLDAEAFFTDTLVRINRLARSRPAREHVTVLPRSERPDLFLLRSVEDYEDNSDLRWTVDNAADLELVRGIYAQLGLGSRTVPYRAILAHVREHPELTRVNAGLDTWDPTR